MENIIFILGAFVLLIFFVFIISMIILSSKKRRRIKQVEKYLMQGWDAVGKKDNTKAREAYDKIREIYKSKYDKKGQIMKRIKLFYNKISETNTQTKPSSSPAKV